MSAAVVGYVLAGALALFLVLRQNRMERRIQIHQRLLLKHLADTATDEQWDRLLKDVRKYAEPGPSRPGSVDHTMPPADVTDSEGKA